MKGNRQVWFAANCGTDHRKQCEKGLNFFWLFSSPPEFVLVYVSCSSENNVNLIELLYKWSIYVYIIDIDDVL